MTSVSFGGENSALQVGVSNGSIYYNVPAKQPESRPKPLMTVPFPHDPDFVGRDELDQLLERSSIPGSRTVLVGLGGVGKSRLAIEYCYQVRQRSPETWVFWVHASTAARCEESVRNLADRANIPGRQDHNANIFQLFVNWLQDGNIKKWVLVIDNVDDDELLRKPLGHKALGTPGENQEAQEAQYRVQTRPPLRYLLETSTGSIVVTSRNKAVAIEIASHGKHLIDVQPMDLTNALLLMQKKLYLDTESEELRQIVEELEFMPLAIVQAASYITNHSPRCSAARYLDMLRSSESQAMKLLSQESYDTHRDWEAKNSISLTWQISFDHIRRIRKSAADLLSLMSFFDWQGIPESLLRVQESDGDLEWEAGIIVSSTRQRLRASIKRLRQSATDLLSLGGFFDKQRTRSLRRAREKYRNHGLLDSPQDYGDISTNETSLSSIKSDVDEDFESDIKILMDYSLIATGKDAMVFTMHRLVQQIVRTWLEGRGEQEKWKECFIINLNQEFPSGEYETWETCRPLFPHVKSAMSHRPKSQHSFRYWADLLSKGAWYARACGHFSESKHMAAMSREGRMSTGDAEAEDLPYINSTWRLEVSHLEAGEWAEAEQLFLLALKCLETTLGVDHPYTLIVMDDLVLTYTFQGRWDEAEQLGVKVMTTRKTVFGAGHRDKLPSMNNLTSLYLFQGRWDEAEQLQFQVLQACKSEFGMDHPHTMTSMSNLAVTLSQQDRLDEAEQLHLQLLEMRTKRLGVNHSDTLSSMNSLAATYHGQGRYVEAEQLGAQVVEMDKKTLGIDHPNTLVDMDNLALILWGQDRLDEAEELQVQVMEMRKKRLGVDHPDTLRSMSNLAVTYRDQGRWGKAERLQLQAMDGRKMRLGMNHPDTLSSMGVLASILWFQSRWHEAEQLEVQVMEARKKKLEVDHPKTLLSMADVACTWDSLAERPRPSICLQPA